MAASQQSVRPAPPNNSTRQHPIHLFAHRQPNLTSACCSSVLNTEKLIATEAHTQTHRKTIATGLVDMRSRKIGYSERRREEDDKLQAHADLHTGRHIDGQTK